MWAVYFVGETEAWFSGSNPGLLTALGAAVAECHRLNALWIGDPPYQPVLVPEDEWSTSPWFGGGK